MIVTYVLSTVEFGRSQWVEMRRYWSSGKVTVDKKDN